MLRSRKNPTSWKRQPAFSRSLLAMAMMWCMVFYGLAPMIIHAQVAVSGNIDPESIQIDGNANLFAGDTTGSVLNSPANLDWVKDSLANSDTIPGSNPPAPGVFDSIAYGIKENVSGAVGGTGHWNGVRVVDGIAGNDQDIFLTGGKENDTSSWNPGPGSVGSSKYDITQAYLANNASNVFFGMERRGNNGTTAFDFEFNKNAPDPAKPYIPTRAIGDVLVTFEMQGSGGSGSAFGYIFKWDSNGTANTTSDDFYKLFCSSDSSAGVPACTAGSDTLISSINNVDTPPAPWGYVSSKGDWVLSPNIPRFEFAEAQVPLSILGFGGGCGSAFVQIRTRSSRVANSDLKDTTKIFEYIFAGPGAVASIDAACDLDISYKGSDSTNSQGLKSGLNYHWVIQQLVSGTWTTVATFDDADGDGTYTASAAGTYRGVLTVDQGNVGCSSDATTAGIAVRDELGVSANTKSATTPSGNDSFANANFKATVTAATSNDFGDTISYQWQQFTGNPAAWSNIGTGISVTRNLDDLFNFGALDGESAFTLAGVQYKFRRASLGLKVIASRTVNAHTCNAEATTTIHGIKAIDP